MRVPFPEVVGRLPPHSPRRRVSWRMRRRTACKRGVNALVGYYNFLELGCPRGSYPELPSLSKVQRVAADRLLEDFMEFCRLKEPGSFGGGRQRLLEALASLGSADPTNEAFSTKSAASVAKEVAVERVALPEIAGGCDPSSILLGAQKWFYEHPEARRLPECQWPRVTQRACHKVPKHVEVPLVRRLILCGMGVLIPDSEVPRGPDGQPYVSGFSQSLIRSSQTD